MIELVILSVGLALKIITPTTFTIMVIMALLTTLMATPLLALVVRQHANPRDGATGGASRAILGATPGARVPTPDATVASQAEGAASGA